MMKIAIEGGHTIEIIHSIFGKETIRYNGNIVSETILALDDSPVFVVKENGKDARYEVTREVKSDGNGYRFTIWKDGVKVFKEK